MRSDQLWEAARRLPAQDLFARQRQSIMRKRARREFAPHIERGEVLSGPFKGMKYIDAAAIGSSAARKLVGTYESELLPIIAEISRSNYQRIVNVGCAEGYYLIGLGCLFDRVELIGYDCDADARQICEANAKLNGIEVDRLRLFGEFDGATFQRALNGEETLVIVDCEGTENEVVMGLEREKLKAADWLIETHDHLVEGTTERLLKVFEGTHALQKVPTNDDLAAKRQLLPDSIKLSYDRYVQEAIVCEERKAKQYWIYAKRKVA